MSGSLGFAEHSLDRLSVRLIGIDRPGLGRSDLDPSGDFSTWSSDVIVLIERLQLEDPLALGFSQGAPYALQLAAVEAVKGVALVAAQDDFGYPAVFDLLPSPVVSMINELRNNKPQFEATIAGSASADWLWTVVMGMSSERDRELFGSEPFARAYRRCLREGFSQGASGYVRDLVKTWSPWPFRLEDLRVPVDIWYGLHDASPVHSPDFGKTMAERIPHARRFVEGEQGSALLWVKGPEVLAELLGPTCKGRLPAP
ncbi:alpha/beta hydrolase [Neorhizobium petrolearium]